ncbi:MAG: type II toxin-antitoxin system VapC family toxin [Saprospiraceae bacterium]|nr:type II toxin-antitoxin system VapC family toxin [Saprospiraceae bacterium]
MRRLLDSNILIYATQPSMFSVVAPLIADPVSLVSEITRLESLGFHRIPLNGKLYLEATFKKMTVLPIDTDIINKAIKLRQQRKMSAGDAIHAATALLHNLELNTRNEADFTWIVGLKVVNPIPQNTNQ